MKRIIYSLILILVIAAGALLGFAATQPDEFVISRSIVIQASASDVYQRIERIKAWESWSPWKARDASIQNTYEGPESGVGAQQSWISENSGSGTLTFTEVIPNQKIAYKLFFKDFQTENQGELNLKEDNGQTTVTWIMRGTNSFMSKVFWVLMNFESAIQADFDQGLGRLKALAESKS